VPNADLYIDRIDLARYLTPEEVGRSGARDAGDLAARLRDGTLALNDCPWFTPEKRYALSLALKAAEVLPPVPSLELPRPLPTELYELNDPDPGAPVLVTGNSEFTLTVLTGLLAATVSPLFLLLVDCRGDTVDMSMVYRSFTPQRLDQSLDAHRLAGTPQPPAPPASGDSGAPAGGTGRLYRLGNPGGADLRRGVASVPGRGLAAAPGVAV
jgi:hypothetical protein